MGQATAPVSVLLVEDEILISKLVADWLSERGFAVREIATAESPLPADLEAAFGVTVSVTTLVHRRAADAGDQLLDGVTHFRLCTHGFGQRTRMATKQKSSSSGHTLHVDLGAKRR